MKHKKGFGKYSIFTVKYCTVSLLPHLKKESDVYNFFFQFFEI